MHYWRALDWADKAIGSWGFTLRTLGSENPRKLLQVCQYSPQGGQKTRIAGKSVWGEEVVFTQYTKRNTVQVQRSIRCILYRRSPPQRRGGDYPYLKKSTLISHKNSITNKASSLSIFGSAKILFSQGSNPVWGKMASIPHFARPR